MSIPGLRLFLVMNDEASLSFSTLSLSLSLSLSLAPPGDRSPHQTSALVAMATRRTLGACKRVQDVGPRRSSVLSSLSLPSSSTPPLVYYMSPLIPPPPPFTPPPRPPPFIPYPIHFDRFPSFLPPAALSLLSFTSR